MGVGPDEVSQGGSSRVDATKLSVSGVKLRGGGALFKIVVIVLCLGCACQRSLLSPLSVAGRITHHRLSPRGPRRPRHRRLGRSCRARPPFRGADYGLRRGRRRRVRADWGLHRARGRGLGARSAAGRPVHQVHCGCGWRCSLEQGVVPVGHLASTSSRIVHRSSRVNLLAAKHGDSRRLGIWVLRNWLSRSKRLLHDGSYPREIRGASVGHRGRRWGSQVPLLHRCRGHGSRRRHTLRGRLRRLPRSCQGCCQGAHFLGQGALAALPGLLKCLCQLANLRHLCIHCGQVLSRRDRPSLVGAVSCPLQGPSVSMHFQDQTFSGVLALSGCGIVAQPRCFLGFPGLCLLGLHVPSHAGQHHPHRAAGLGVLRLTLRVLENCARNSALAVVLAPSGKGSPAHSLSRRFLCGRGFQPMPGRLRPASVLLLVLSGHSWSR
mmetsp:Transcript_34505/g.75495  ORF Transcript_34505/g.75495 Transcript_34505/m.75495 type:complete len:436 (-) Transcript_34505:321-1628(-)